MQYIEETAAYCRVSKDEINKHGLSIDAQKQKLIEYAEKNHLKIVEWYIDEGVSGRKPIAKRPELQRMINDAIGGRFKRIIFIRLDRYFRSVKEYYACQSMLDKTGVTWTATEEKYSLADANGRAFVNMKLTIAELEADTGGDRIRIVNAYKVKSGMPLVGDHSLPFCYGVGRKEGSKEKFIVKTNEEAMNDLVSYVLLHKAIRQAVFYVRQKHDIHLTYRMAMTALHNEMICGSYRGNPNYCPPYITREMFDTLQEIIQQNPRSSEREHTYIFSGLLLCPKCGRKLTGAMHCPRRGEKLYRYYAYKCGRNRINNSCDFKIIIFENTLERKLLENIADIVDDQEAKSIEIQQKAQRVSKYDMQELQAELDRLNYSWQKGRIKNVEEYDTKYDKLIAQIEEAKAEQHELSGVPDFGKIRSVLEGGWKEIYKNLDDDHKRSFWRAFIKNIHLTWDKSTKEIDHIDFF